MLAGRSPSLQDDMKAIKQEQSPVCAFLASLAATADWTGRFPKFGDSNKDLLNPDFIKYDSASDTYGILLYVGGKWQRYWVNGDWTESYMPSGALWTTLYLKAYLKACNVNTFYSDYTPINPDYWYSTSNTAWQNASTALTMLTGDTTKFISSLSAQTMHDQIAYGYILVASSKDTGVSWPVVADHAYAVYDVYKESGIWYVKLYNPWGEDAPKSTGGTMAQYGANDGLIRITWSQFVINYEGYFKC